MKLTNAQPIKRTAEIKSIKIVIFIGRNSTDTVNLYAKSNFNHVLRNRCFITNKKLALSK